MSNDRPGRPAVAIGPNGQPMTLDDLPPPNTKRWVIRRKAEVVAGVRAGLLSLEEACERYKLSVEEFISWQRLIDRHGVRGLRTTRLQDYRDPDGTNGSDDNFGFQAAE
ncbi:MAG: CtrA inhibitor SciP [Kiloniellales bacterium]